MAFQRHLLFDVSAFGAMALRAPLAIWCFILMSSKCSPAKRDLLKMPKSYM